MGGWEAASATGVKRRRLELPAAGKECSMSREESDVLDALGMLAKGEDALEEGVVKKKKDAQIGDDEEVPVYL